MPATLDAFRAALHGPFEEGVEKDTLSPTELGSLTVDTSDQVQLTQRITVPCSSHRALRPALAQPHRLLRHESAGAQGGVVLVSRRLVHARRYPGAGHSINSNLRVPDFFELTFSWMRSRPGAKVTLMPRGA